MSTYVYRYMTDDEPWLYVGKSDCNLKGRLLAHSKEDKFSPFLKICKIVYVELSNPAQSKFVESYLIDKYKPLLNKIDKYDGVSNFELNIPQWKAIENYEHHPNSAKLSQCKAMTSKGNTNVQNVILFYKDFCKYLRSQLEKANDQWFQISRMCCNAQSSEAKLRLKNIEYFDEIIKLNQEIRQLKFELDIKNRILEGEYTVKIIQTIKEQNPNYKIRIRYNIFKQLKCKRR